MQNLNHNLITGYLKAQAIVSAVLLIIIIIAMFY